MILRQMEFDDISAMAEIEKENFEGAEIWSANGLLTHLLREDALYFVAEAESGEAPPEEPGDPMPETAAVSLDEDGEEDWEEPDILGYAGLLMVPDEADITKVSVRKDAQGRGIGKQLLDALHALAYEYGVRKVFLDVRESNLPARRLYEKCGYREVGRRKEYYSDPAEDAVLMRCDL